MINHEEDLRQTPQSHDELEVDYNLIPLKWRVIVAVFILMLFAGILYLGFS